MPGIDVDQDNRIQSDYDESFNSIVNQDKIASDLQELENKSNLSTGDFEDSKATAKGNSDQTGIVKNSEEAGNTHSSRLKPEHRGWENRVTPHDVVDKNKLGQAMGFAKKHKGILGLISVFGVSGAMLTAFFGPASMIINLMENLSITNDTSSRSLERRFLKVFQNASSQDPICVNATKKTIKCSMGVISNKALKNLEKKGVVGLANGSPVRTKSTGYPDKKPTHYEIDLKDGSSPKPIKVEDLPGFLSQKENSKLAAKILGTGGAMNLRVKTWAGKHIYSKFYNKFGLRLNGGIAAMIGTLEGNITKKLASYRDKLPGSEKLAQASDKITKTLDSHLSKVKKAGAAYTISVAGCITAKAPSMIAAGAAAVQLAQVMPPIMDMILSPGSMAKANGVTNTFTSDGMNLVGTALTEQTPREGDGKLSTALDSVYLLSALGVSKGKPAPSKKYTPGYGILTNDLVKASAQAAEISKPMCTTLMSPPAMYAAISAEVVSTVAASATIIGGIIKIAASWAISELVAGVIKNVLSDQVKGIFKDLATNKDIPKARGQAFGDVLGIGASAFFSAGGMARHMPVISKKKLAEVSQEQNIAEEMRKEMDIASLSPFDTSSRYTFLGSIVHDVKFAMLANNSYNDSLFSVASNMVRLPQLAMSIATPKASAADITRLCDYAEYFGLNGEDEAKTPAINMAGLPCVAYDTNQIAMTPIQAIDLMIKEGWLDENVDIELSDSITDLVNKKFIVPETPLADIIESCSDASTGDYLFNAGGCIVPESVNTDGEVAYCDKVQNDEGETIKSCSQIQRDESDADTPEFKIASDPRSMAAINVFLGDYQMVKSMNGEDEGYGDGSTGTPGGPISLVDPTQWAVPTNHNGEIDKNSDQWKRWTTDLGDNGNTSTGVLKPINTTNPNYCSPDANTLNKYGGGNLFNPNAAAAAEALTKAFNEANPGRYFVGGACFRSIKAQEIAYGDGSSGFAATPGTSNHGWGLAIDVRIATSPDGVGTSISSFQSKDYLWLIANSPQFGWVNPIAMRPEAGCYQRGQKVAGKSPCEPWHFQYVGPLYGS